MQLASRSFYSAIILIALGVLIGAVIIPTVLVDPPSWVTSETTETPIFITQDLQQQLYYCKDLEVKARMLVDEVQLEPDSAMVTVFAGNYAAYLDHFWVYPEGLESMSAQLGITLTPSIRQEIARDPYAIIVSTNRLSLSPPKKLKAKRIVLDIIRD